LIGGGTYGEVFLGEHIQTHEPYIFKVYRFGKRTQSKMMREILVTQAVCGNENIVELKHVIQQSLTKYPVLLFDYINNTSAKVPGFYASLSPDEVRYYAYKILDGLAYAHGKGVMHKDLKPENVVIDHSKRQLKIIDWGMGNFCFKGQ
jgi:casein kinase II subunit alpha